MHILPNCASVFVCAPFSIHCPSKKNVATVASGNLDN